MNGLGRFLGRSTLVLSLLCIVVHGSAFGADVVLGVRGGVEAVSDVHAMDFANGLPFVGGDVGVGLGERWELRCSVFRARGNAGSFVAQFHENTRVTLEVSRVLDELSVWNVCPFLELGLGRSRLYSRNDEFTFGYFAGQPIRLRASEIKRTVYHLLFGGGFKYAISKRFSMCVALDGLAMPMNSTTWKVWEWETYEWGGYWSYEALAYVGLRVRI